MNQFTRDAIVPGDITLLVEPKNTTQYFMGIDPDMHTMPVVIIDIVGKLKQIAIIKVAKEFTGREALIEMAKAVKVTGTWAINALCVEGQELYQFGSSKTKNPKSIMYLATVAGAAMAHFAPVANGPVYFPTPQEWKGNVPKQIHQARILSRMGIDYTKVGSQSDGYCVPISNNGFDIKKGEWKHVVDAIGLATYARDMYVQNAARVERAARET